MRFGALIGLFVGLAAPAFAEPPWQELEEGLAKAKATGVPIMLWVTSCPTCVEKALSDPDVTSMLADFVPVRAEPAEVRHLTQTIAERAAVILDASGVPLKGLAVKPDHSGALSPDALIDAMSSALDMVR